MGRPSATPDGESRALTGLRGVGAMLVMAHHLYLHLGLGIHAPALEGLLRRGFMGVDLFFILSGFIMSMVYGTWFDQSGPGRTHRVATFLIRRVARLWPLHAAVLAVLVAAGPAVSGIQPSWHMVATNATMVQTWGFSAAINPPAWSVSVEFLAYLLFPTVAIPLLRSRAGPWLGAVTVTALLTLCLHFAPPLGPARRGWLDVYYNYSPLPALRCLAGFTLGMMAWRAGQLPACRRWAATAWLGPLALLLFTLLLLARTNGLLAYTLLPLAILGMHYGRGPAVRCLAQGPIHAIGAISYAIYLIHYALLTAFPLHWAATPLVLGTYVATTLGLATLAHYAIESPGRSLIRRLGDSALTLMLPSPAPPLRHRPPSTM